MKSVALCVTKGMESPDGASGDPGVVGRYGPTNAVVVRDYLPVTTGDFDIIGNRDEAVEHRFERAAFQFPPPPFLRAEIELPNRHK